MSRDNIVYTACGFLLGLVLGSMLIGPKLARSKLAGAPPVTVAAAAAEAPPVAAAPAAAPAQGSPMGAVFQRITELKQEIEKNPNNFDAISQLGSMYMDAGKYPQAIEYFERALRVKDDPQVRTDLGICYRNMGDTARSLNAFREVVQRHPEQWQAMFNEVILLAETHRVDEARAVLAKLEKLRPGDPDVQRLGQSLAQAK
jgi:tetratricopeptide (TPR) repeat protein